MLSVQPFQQRLGYCGPASLKIVFEYYGLVMSEQKLAQLCRASKSSGTPAVRLIQVARDLGFSARIMDECSISELRRQLQRKKVPVIVNWFSDYEGHYSVCIGMDSDNLYLQDPELGHRRAFRIKQFKRVWFDFSPDTMRSPKHLVVRRMLVIKPRKRQTKSQRVGV